MPDIDAMLAPRALTSEEVASIIAHELIAYGLCHRAFTHAYIWDEQRCENDTRTAAESVLVDIGKSARESLDSWLLDMQVEGEPRFFNKSGLGKAVNSLLSAASSEFAKAESPAEVAALIDHIEHREPQLMGHLIEAAGR